MNEPKSKRAKRTGGADTAIMNEIDVLLSDFEFTRHQFINFMIDMEGRYERKNQLEAGNCNQYFNGRSVPLHHLLRIADYLLAFEIEIPEEEETRLEAYRSGAQHIREKVLDYISIGMEQPIFFRRVIRAVLRVMGDAEIEHLFCSLYRFSVPKHVWDFWTCYCCLDYLAQEKIRQMLSAPGVEPTIFAKKLMGLHIWELEVNAPIYFKFEKSTKKYREQHSKAKADKEITKIRDEYINYLVGLLQTYPYIPTDVLCFEERVALRLEMSDWAILSTYSLLYNTLEAEDLKKIDETLLEYVSDETNWPCITDEKGQRQVLQRKIVERYIGKFIESSYYI